VRATVESAPTAVLYSDYACPFCYLAKPALESLRAEFGVSVQWRPYELRPEGAPLPELGSAYLEQAWRRVFELAEELGAPIRRPTHRPRTRRALEVALFALEQGRLWAYDQAVLEALFLHDQDISSPDVLGPLAEAAGLCAHEALAHIENGTYTHKVDASRRAGDDDAVEGVPTLILGSQRVVGAQPYPALREAYLAAVRGPTH